MTDQETIEALRRELENTQTANHGLRVELHVTQQNLLAQQAATASLARGAAYARSEHLQDVAKLRALLGESKAHAANLERTVQAQAEQMGKLGKALDPKP